jgi:Ca2+-binding EF-hand superfamily protein
MSQENVRERLRRRFQRWDTDNSGTLERADFEREADAIARRMGESLNGPKATQLKRALTAMFSDLAKDGGASPGGSVSWDQYCHAAQRWMERDEDVLRQHLRPMVEAVVAMADRNGNGRIEREEFIGWISAIGAGNSQAIDAFDQIDLNGNGELSADEVLQAVVDFHLGRSKFELL